VKLDAESVAIILALFQASTTPMLLMQ
jgi:hypothetical protein